MEKEKMQGQWRIEAVDAQTGEILQVFEFHNMLTKINQSIRDQMLMGTYTGAKTAVNIKYFAFGTGTTNPTENDTQLVAEMYRKQVTQKTNPSAGNVRSICSLGANEANFFIQEIGVFAGDSASDTPDSGTLVSRALFSYNKNSNIILNIVRDDYCTIGG